MRQKRGEHGSTYMRDIPAYAQMEKRWTKAVNERNSWTAYSLRTKRT